MYELQKVIMLVICRYKIKKEVITEICKKKHVSIKEKFT